MNSRISTPARRRFFRLAAVGSALLLGACGAAEDLRYVADKMAARKKAEVTPGGGAPLSLPPTYGLRPPATRSRGSSAGTAKLSRTVLKVGAPSGTGGERVAPVKGRSQGESEVLRKAGLGNTTTGVVRKTLDIENQREKTGRQTFVNKVLKYDPKARKENDDGRGEDSKGRSATLSRPSID